MTPDKPKSTTAGAVDWSEGTREVWTKVQNFRGSKNGYLWLLPAPYLVTGALTAAGLGQHGSDGAVLTAFGGGLFLIFVLMFPFWLHYCLSGWWQARKQFLDYRTHFWKVHRVDPLEVTPPSPPPRPAPPKPPWER